jgi:hypothetical protein
MTRTIQKILVILGIAGTTLLQAGGCDTLATQFVQGIEAGYTSVTGTSLFEDIGKGLAGGTGSEVEYGTPWDEPDCCGYGAYYWEVW